MQWKKDLTTNKKFEHDIILALTILLLVVSIYLDRRLAFMFIGIISVYLIGLKLYNRQIAQKLTMDMLDQSFRAFPGESIELNLTIKNNSLIPYINGFLLFSTKGHVLNNDYLHTTRQGYNEYRVPVSISGKSKVSISIPLKAIKRGAGRIKHIRLTFPHLLNFEYFTLTYTEPLHHELIVYPNYQPIKFIKDIRNQYLGQDITTLSQFEDILQPMGTRDYTTSDPFHRIHWKASAKMQKLQTKTYERNHHMVWTILVNISEKSPLGNLYTSPMLEEILSKTAYICNILIQRGYEVEIYVNEYGSVHLPGGRDINHLKRLLNLITRIGTEYMIQPIQNVLYQLHQSHIQPRMIILIGEFDETNYDIINKLTSKGHRLYHISDSHIDPFIKGKDMYG
ncbi:DUF58 domain-containing protein [Lentibacillus amyloliquefaciens]|uniref:DUF58 domain-containing protein n=1 Tax=Lentibacillus amyloliquefaciens TaxID=1472767 RepID=A0A0U3W216_9BACI|nr:DUF58 domain-containing protein [Lentibacillus amyloliquefaciens]ALX47216.1 hypothetical protein AOX59_00540 [Lentibacillus amyloliquefaciens]